MGSKLEDPDSAHLHHRAMLEQVVGSTFAPESVVYTYKRSFNGFAVKLTKEEAKKIASMKGVVSVFPNRNNELHTTRSWDFLGSRKCSSCKKCIKQHSGRSFGHRNLAGVSQLQ